MLYYNCRNVLLRYKNTNLVHHGKNTVHSLLWSVFFFWQLHSVPLKHQIITLCTIQTTQLQESNVW